MNDVVRNWYYTYQKTRLWIPRKGIRWLSNCYHVQRWQHVRSNEKKAERLIQDQYFISEDEYLLNKLSDRLQNPINR